MVILILDKADFRTRTVAKDKEGHSIKMKDIAVLNVYVLTTELQNTRRRA